MKVIAGEARIAGNPFTSTVPVLVLEFNDSNNSFVLAIDLQAKKPYIGFTPQMLEWELKLEANNLAEGLRSFADVVERITFESEEENRSPGNTASSD